MDPRAAAVTSRHARPGCWCRVEARDSRGGDDETTLIIDEASEPVVSHRSHSTCSAVLSVTLGGTCANQSSIHWRKVDVDIVVSKWKRSFTLMCAQDSSSYEGVGGV